MVLVSQYCSTFRLSECGRFLYGKSVNNSKRKGGVLQVGFNISHVPISEFSVYLGRDVFTICDCIKVFNNLCFIRLWKMKILNKASKQMIKKCNYQ